MHNTGLYEWNTVRAADELDTPTRRVRKFINGLPKAVFYLCTKVENGPERHIAHCLNFNLMAFGATQKAAVEKLDEMVAVYVLTAFLDDGPEVIVEWRADELYWAMFFDNKPKLAGTVGVRITDKVLKMASKNIFSFKGLLSLDTSRIDASVREQFRKVLIHKLITVV